MHTHSEFSSDSEQSVELMAETAIEKGLSFLGISDHYDYNFFPEEKYPNNFECDPSAKEKEILRAKEVYKGRLTVLNGIELGLDVRNTFKCKEITDKFRFDYIIGSQHIVSGEDPYPPEYWTGKNVKKVVKEYFEDILRSVDSFPDFDIFGHLDYPLRYPPEVKAGKLDAEEILESKEIKSLCSEVLSVLAKEGKALEINTGAMRSALRRTNPSVKLLKEFLSLGGKYVTFGSDAHFSEHIGYGFGEFRSMLTSLGKDTYTVYENRTPREIKL